MKAKILEALTTKFEGVSSSILDRIATKLAKTITKADDVATAVEGVTLQQVIEGYADSRANESAATARKKAVEEYETRYGLKDGVKAESKDKDAKKQNPEEEEMPAWAKVLAARLDKQDAERLATQRTERLNSIVNKLPESLRKGYARLSVDGSDEEFEKLITEVTTEVDAIEKDTRAAGARLGRPLNNGKSSKGNEASKEDIDAVVAAMRP